jgi:3-oxoacyl-[acyl-carrier protein] reductase
MAVADQRPLAVVTGGTRGIGFGIASALARDGWNLVIAGLRSRDAVENVVNSLAEQGGRVRYVPVDVGRRADRARLVEEVGTLGPPSALVNNAGRAPVVRTDLLETTEESFEDLLRTNLQGPYFLAQAFASAMVATRVRRPVRGGIVFITSVSAEMASINRGEYCVSKAGLAMAVKLFAARLAPHGIPVYEIRPGIIATDMTAGVKDLYDRRISEGLVPQGRWGTPDDVGSAVAALLRGDVPYATGTVIHIDGGLTIPRL